MALIKDSDKTTVAEHSIDLHINDRNFLPLKTEDTIIHLEMLRKMLEKMRKLIHRKLPQEGGENIDLISYLQRLAWTLDVMILKSKIESLKPNRDIQLPCAIDPSDSGFPIFVRDIKFLNTDKKKAAQELGELPKDEQLIDEALFLLFRGYFPKDVILQKLTRNYYEKLFKLSLPEILKIYEAKAFISGGEGVCYYKQSFERFDDHSNIPRFYSLHLKIPLKSYDKEEWKTEMFQAISDGLSSVINLELGYLAKKIEDIEGIQVEYIERFDVGPFYNRYTEKKSKLSSLIAAEDDCMLLFRKYSVVRTGQKERTGAINWFKGLISGDKHIGYFSPLIASPQYVLMPHRLIQKVYNQNVSIENTKMYGITSTGKII